MNLALAAAATGLVIAAGLSPAAAAQTIQGTLFEDVNRNGVRDFGEPALAGVPVTLFGDGGAVDVAGASGADGTFSFVVSAAGREFVLDVQPGPGWRESFQDLGGDPDPIPDWPQGRRRPGATDFLVANLRAATSGAPLVHVALGDSIAYGFNLCDSTSGQNDYVTPLTGRLGSASAGATLIKLAVLGQQTNDLLVPNGSGTIYDAINAGAQLVSLSIGGNDYLNDDGNTAATAANLVAARQNLQEILSTLESELPGADVVLNTVYDNKGGSNAFHNTWGPIWDQALRDAAWGQLRRVAIAEIFPDYAHLDAGTNTVLGETGLICNFLGLDGIHPKRRGYDLHEQKVWQGIGGVESSAATETRDFGWIRQIGTRLPTVATDLVGGATGLADALTQDDVGASIPGGDQEVRLSGFDATPNGKLAQVVVHVRYRTSAPPTDDVYRFEASVDGTFAAPGADSTSWNTIVPIVGGAGVGAPVLARPDQPNWREVSALVTKGSQVDGAPSLTWQDLANLTVRVKGGAVGGADAFAVEWDVASIDLYGVPPFTLMASGTAQIGGNFSLEATGKSGDDTWLFLSSAPGSLPFPPWGTLGVDLSHFLLLHTGSIGAAGTATIGGAIPNDPALVGLSTWFQSVVVEDYVTKSGALTNTVEVTFE